MASYDTEKLYSNIRCGGLLNHHLDNLFCDQLPQFWHLEYLDNYKCCTEERFSVLTTPDCLDQETGVWSSWSSWSQCERVIRWGGAGVETVRKRYRLGQGQSCLFVLLDSQLCQDEKDQFYINSDRNKNDSFSSQRGGCAIANIANTLPFCSI